MKKTYLSILMPLMALIALFSLSSNSNGPGGNKTGAPGSSGNCSACHGNASDPAAIVKIKITDNGTPVTTYIPGKTYDLELNISAFSSKKGFQLSAVNDKNSAAGTLSNNSSGTTIYTSGTQQIWGHSTVGSGIWTAKWTAPETNTGSVIFYVAAVFADGNGMNSGDKFHAYNMEITEEMNNHSNALKTNKVKLVQNPVNETLQLSGEVKAGYIWNSQGQLVQSFQNNSQCNIQKLASGVYHLNFVHLDGSTGATRFVKQ